uniref:Uncharacterized protein n=1 Tax=viral metagenome TaxID=1070528 RepID=A0A6M3IDQ9_9ZZZZ
MGEYDSLAEFMGRAGEQDIENSRTRKPVPARSASEDKSPFVGDGTLWDMEITLWPHFPEFPDLPDYPEYVFPAIPDWPEGPWPGDTGPGYWDTPGATWPDPESPDVGDYVWTIRHPPDEVYPEEPEEGEPPPEGPFQWLPDPDGGGSCSISCPATIECGKTLVCVINHDAATIVDGVTVNGPVLGHAVIGKNIEIKVSGQAEEGDVIKITVTTTTIPPTSHFGAFPITGVPKFSGAGGWGSCTQNVRVTCGEACECVGGDVTIETTASQAYIDPSGDQVYRYVIAGSSSETMSVDPAGGACGPITWSASGANFFIGESGWSVTLTTNASACTSGGGCLTTVTATDACGISDTMTLYCSNGGYVQAAGNPQCGLSGAWTEFEPGGSYEKFYLVDEDLMQMQWVYKTGGGAGACYGDCTEPTPAWAAMNCIDNYPGGIPGSETVPAGFMVWCVDLIAPAEGNVNCYANKYLLLYEWSCP